jgi:hypothetical protein
MTEQPSADEFITGWIVQNVETGDRADISSLVAACRNAAQERGISIDEAAAAARIGEEIARYRANGAERAYSRDD